MTRQVGSTHSERYQFWAEAVQGCQGSGLTVREYCRRRRLSEAGFYWWRRRLLAAGDVGKADGTRGRRRSKAAPMFIPIRVPGTDGALGPTAKRPSTEPPADPGWIEIVVAGGRVLRIGPGFDPATLRQVLGVLEGQPC